jgi:LmbE family N-acetylglucosaminyl deacetylase
MTEQNLAPIHTLVLLLIAATALAAVGQQIPAGSVPPAQPHVLLAVTAHPDDEILLGPVLARYAREGATVYLAIATKGEKGTNDFAKIPSGDPLADARRAEATCACKQLGIEPPIFFNLNDGELGAMTSPLAKNIQAVADNVQKLIDQLHPEVILTWGPDGGYGHPDHRLVSNAVTQVVQSQPPGIKLYYAGLSPAQARPINAAWYAFMPFHTTDPAYLTVNITYTPRDFENFQRAFECNKSQFAPEDFRALEKAMNEGWGGTVSFREWNSTRSATDFFQ